MRAYRCFHTVSTTYTPVSATGRLRMGGTDCSDVAIAATRSLRNVCSFRHHAERGRFLTHLASRKTGLCRAIVCNFNMK